MANLIDRIVIYNPYPNKSVTEHYIQIVESAINKLEIETIITEKLEQCLDNEKCGAFVISPEDVVRAKKKGYSPVFVWVQGVVPEESYMRHHSLIRKWLLSFAEIYGLKHADVVFYISKAMEEHYKSKYGFIAKESYIMPCFDTDFQLDSFYKENKYVNNEFLYAGSIQVWQCFEETLDLYRNIECKVTNASLRVLTKDKEAAEEMIKARDIKNYSIDFVSHDQVNEELKQAKFGFSIRKDSIVNRVATPTKLSTYVANGVIPIYSTVLSDFASVAANSTYCVCLSQDESFDITHIVSLCNEEIKPEIILNSFKESFGTHYSTSIHMDNIRKLLLNYIQPRRHWV